MNLNSLHGKFLIITGDFYLFWHDLWLQQWSLIGWLTLHSAPFSCGKIMELCRPVELNHVLSTHPKGQKLSSFVGFVPDPSLHDTFCITCYNSKYIYLVLWETLFVHGGNTPLAFHKLWAFFKIKHWSNTEKISCLLLNHFLLWLV